MTTVTDDIGPCTAILYVARSSGTSSPTDLGLCIFLWSVTGLELVKASYF